MTKYLNILILSVTFLSSCMTPVEKGQIDVTLVKNSKTRIGAPVINTVRLENDQLIVEGSAFLNLTSAKINSSNLSYVGEENSTNFHGQLRLTSFFINSYFNMVETDDDSEDSALGFGVDYYISDPIYIGIAYESLSSKDTGASIKEDETRVISSVGYANKQGLILEVAYSSVDFKSNEGTISKTEEGNNLVVNLAYSF